MVLSYFNVDPYCVDGVRISIRYASVSICQCIYGLPGTRGRIGPWHPLALCKRRRLGRVDLFSPWRWPSLPTYNPHILGSLQDGLFLGEIWMKIRISFL